MCFPLSDKTPYWQCEIGQDRTGRVGGMDGEIEEKKNSDFGFECEEQPTVILSQVC